MKQTVNDNTFLVSVWKPKAMYFHLVYKELCKSQLTVIQAHTGGYVSNGGLPVSKQSKMRSEATTAVLSNNKIKYECAS
jgi:hypothetical protein